jgi:PDZ domain-containing secreted protein
MNAMISCKNCGREFRLRAVRINSEQKSIKDDTFSNVNEVCPNCGEMNTGYVLSNINGTEIELRGDAILRIDSRTANTIEDILSYLDTKKVGDIVQLTILRDGRAENVSVQLGPSSMASRSIESPTRCSESLGKSLCDQLFER